MPFTRILVQSGRSAEELKIISDTLHQTLVDAFHVPHDDRFQVIEEYPEERFNYDFNYQTGKRTSKFTMFNIIAGKPRDLNTKESFYKKLCQRITERTDIPEDDIMIVIQFTQPDDWSFGRGIRFSLT